MAFIVCRTCGEQVADTAPECPNCGTPTGVEPPERPKPWKKYALVSAGVLLAAGILALVVRKEDPQPKKKEAAETVQPAAKAPQPAVATPPPPPKPVEKAPQQEATVDRGTQGNGVYFLAGYTSGADGREFLKEIRPVVAQDESAMNEVMKGGTGALAFRPLGLACGPEREPYYAWVHSRDAAPQPNFRAGAACGYSSPTAAAQRALEGCRERGGCQRTDAEIQLYAGDVRDGAGEEWRGKPRLWCQFTAGSIVNAWQYGPQKTDFSSGCASLLSQ